MSITGGCRCRAVRYNIDAERITARHCWCRDCQYIGAGNVFFPSEAVQVEGALIGLHEPRSQRQPDAPAILPDMWDACVHAKRCPAAHDRRAGWHPGRPRHRQASDDNLDVKRTELGRVRSEHSEG